MIGWIKGVVKDHVKTGQWTKIGAHCRFGANVELGDWSEIGARCELGDDVKLGPWASLGDDVEIGAGTVLGTHTRVMSGVSVPSNLVIPDDALVTPDGILEKRCSGHSRGANTDGRYVSVSHVSGRYQIPMYPGQHPEDAIDVAGHLLEDYQWGRSDKIREFLIEAPEASCEKQISRDEISKSLDFSSRQRQTLSSDLLDFQS